jgi:hypothetical protein
MPVMTGSGRLGGRGAGVATAQVATAQVPTPSPAQPLRTPFRLVSVLVAQLFDFATFTIMVGVHGIGTELNPLVAQGFATFGMPMLVLMKIALVVLLTSTIVVLSQDRRAGRSVLDLAALITVLAVAGGLIGGISNVLAT